MKMKIFLLLLIIAILSASLTSCRQLSQRELERFTAGAAEFHSDNEEFFDLLLIAWSRLIEFNVTSSKVGNSSTLVAVYINNGGLVVGINSEIAYIVSKIDLLSLEEWEVVETVLVGHIDYGGIDVHLSAEMIHVSSYVGTFGGPITAFERWVAILPWTLQEPRVIELDENWGVVF